MVILFKFQTLIFLIIFVVFNTKTSAQNKTFPCELWKSVVLNQTDSINKDGSIMKYYKGEPFKKDLTFEVNGILRGCICSVKYCLRKCCPEGKSLNKDGVCENNTKQFTVDSFNYYDVKDLEVIQRPVKADHFVVVNTVENILNCEPYALDKITDSYYLLINGSLLYRTKSNFPYELATIDNYCMEYYYDANNTVPVVCPTLLVASSASSMSQTSLLSDYNLKRIRLIIYPATIITSLPFLVATFVLYCMLEELHTFTGKSLLCQIGSLLIGFAILSILMVNGSNLSSAPCTIMGKIFIIIIILFTFFGLKFFIFQ